MLCYDVTSRPGRAGPAGAEGVARSNGGGGGSGAGKVRKDAAVVGCGGACLLWEGTNSLSRRDVGRDVMPCDVMSIVCVKTAGAVAIVSVRQRGCRTLG